MTPEEFRRYGKELVDWIADYQERIESFPVLSQVEPGAIRKRLPVSPPETGERFDAMMRDVEEIVLPGITHWQSPSFFAYFPSNSSGPSVLGELLSAGLGIQGMIWATSPAATELETHVLDWLVDMLGLPKAEASFRTPPRAPSSAPFSPRASARPRTARIRRAAGATSSPTPRPRRTPRSRKPPRSRESEARTSVWWRSTKPSPCRHPPSKSEFAPT